jgi:hypothetical protein
LHFLAQHIADKTHLALLLDRPPAHLIHLRGTAALGGYCITMDLRINTNPESIKRL